MRKWILLTEPDDPTSTPKGYLKITICVLGAGDQPPVSCLFDVYICFIFNFIQRMTKVMMIVKMLKGEFETN